MGLEQICVGVVICLVVFIISFIFAAVLNSIHDNYFGYFMSSVIGHRVRWSRYMYHLYFI